MNEHLDQNQLTEQIKHIIKSKNWYSLTESNRFLWEESVRLMAGMISKEIKHISPEQIKEIIEGSFTEEALSQAGSKYFIDCLLEIDPSLVLWSEGDASWQKLKASRTGLTNREGVRAEFISKNKTAELKNIILSLIEKFGKEICIVVIDDKEKNLSHVTNLKDEVLNFGVTIQTYHINLHDFKNNPDACLVFLREIKANKIKLIVDMDGVLVDTDLVLSETVSRKIAKELMYTESI